MPEETSFKACREAEDKDTTGGVVLTSLAHSVYINDQLAATAGSAISTMKASGVILTGSNKVFVNDLPLAMVGSKTSFGTMETGSDNVFCS